MDGTLIDLAFKSLKWLFDNPATTWSGIGNYALELTGGAVLAVASCVYRRKKKSPPSSEEDLRQPIPAQKTDNKFNSGGGEQNIAQGDHATGKLVNNHGPVISTSGNQSPAVNAQTVTITYGVAQEKYDQIKKDLDIGDAAFASFFKILEQGSIPREEWGAKLPEIAFRYKELLQRFEAVTSDDPQVKALKEQAGQAIKNGEYDRADELLNQAKERDRAAIAKLKEGIAEQQAALEKRQLSEAASCVEQAKLQEIQYRYNKAAEYWQEAAVSLPEGHKQKRAFYLNQAGYDLFLIAHYAFALPLFQDSLLNYRKIGDRKGELAVLNNISGIHWAQGDYATALEYQKYILRKKQDIKDWKGIGITLNNISQIYNAWGDHAKAIKHLEQSLLTSRQEGDKEGEGRALHNIGGIYWAQGDYVTALKCFKQSLTISCEIKDKRMKAGALCGIGKVRHSQGDSETAMKYLKKSLAIQQQIGDRAGEGITLNDIGWLYGVQDDYEIAFKYLKQGLAILCEIGDKMGEAATRWNIGGFYKEQEKWDKAELYISTAIKIEEQIRHPLLEKHRQTLKDVRAKLYG